VRGLVSEGLDVTLYCTSLHASVAGVSKVVETLRFASARVPHRLLGVSRAWRYHDWRASRALRQGAFDLVHCWPAGCLQTLAAANAAGVVSFREAPSAHTAEAYDACARESARIGLELPLGHSHRHDAAALRRELLEFDAADRVLVPSDYVFRTFVERGFDPERLTRHTYGYDPSTFFPGPTPPDDGRLRAVFVGRGDLGKGLHHALDAWIESGAAERGRLSILGEISPPYAQMLARGLSHPSVSVTGFVDGVADYLRDADVLLLPSITEGSALVTYEAQACGCVLLVSDAAGADCIDGVTAFVHRVGDVQTLTEQLRAITHDTTRLRKMRTATLEHAKGLTWAAAGRTLAVAYTSSMSASVQAHEPETPAIARQRRG
jgi:glycosyltransferase involved in cell wall biosynthesis